MSRLVIIIFHYVRQVLVLLLVFIYFIRVKKIYYFNLIVKIPFQILKITHYPNKNNETARYIILPIELYEITENCHANNCPLTILLRYHVKYFLNTFQSTTYISFLFGRVIFFKLKFSTYRQEKVF